MSFSHVYSAATETRRKNFTLGLPVPLPIFLVEQNQKSLPLLSIATTRDVARLELAVHGKSAGVIHHMLGLIYRSRPLNFLGVSSSSYLYLTDEINRLV